MKGDAEEKNQPSARTPAFLLVLLLLFHAVAGIGWIRSDTTMRGVDELDYLMFLQRFETDLAMVDRSVKQQLKTALWDSPSLLPGFSFGLAKVAYQVFGRSLASARTVSVLSFLALLIVLYRFGADIAGPWAGLCASGLISFFPLAFTNARYFNFFVVSALMVTLTCWLLAKSKRLTRGPIVLATGLAAGCAILTERGIPPLFMAGPALVVFGDALIAKARPAKRLVFQPLLWGFFALALTLAIGGPYLYSYFIQTLGHNIQEITNPQYPSSNPAYHFYFTEGFGQFMGIPLILTVFSASALMAWKTSLKWLPIAFFPALLLGGAGLTEYAWIALWAAVCFSLVISSIRHRGLLLAWLIVPLILLSVFEKKSALYLFDLMPAVALAAGAMLVQSADSLLRRVIVLALAAGALAFGLLQMIALSFDVPMANRLYENMPQALQTKGFGFRYAHPTKGSRETAMKILGTLPGAADGGLLLHLPGVWSPEKKSKIEPEAVVTEIMWSEQIQIWINYAEPKIRHLIVDRRLVAALPWANPAVDTFAWLPASDYPQTQPPGDSPISHRPQPFVYLDSGFPDDRSKLSDILSRLPSLPGSTLARIPFADNTTIEITRLARPDEAVYP